MHGERFSRVALRHEEMKALLCHNDIFTGSCPAHEYGIALWSRQVKVCTSYFDD